MPAQPSFPAAELESICRVLAETETGLTGTEIGNLLSAVSIADPAPNLTKWKRLQAALAEKQHRDRCANNVIQFILESMKPVRYASNPEKFEARRSALNQVLVFTGLELGNDGLLRSRATAKTLAEAQERADRLRAELRRRKVHADVIRFCQAELLQENYFHAVLEATKSLSEKIRIKSGLSGDAGELAQKAFSLGRPGIPILAFNSLQSETERSEQSGLMNLFIGMFGTFRNVTAHGPKLVWNITEQDALDLLTLVSLLHRRLDAAAPTGRKE
ncbi:MAG: TIGR02391 family protein [Verrucomicrobiales bacterium]|nr:TIGR02391 family protein [Verrucomicrobiales bacterium]